MSLLMGNSRSCTTVCNLVDHQFLLAKLRMSSQVSPPFTTLLSQLPYHNTSGSGCSGRGERRCGACACRGDRRTSARQQQCSGRGCILLHACGKTKRHYSIYCTALVSYVNQCRQHTHLALRSYCFAIVFQDGTRGTASLIQYNTIAKGHSCVQHNSVVF